jgi:putative hemolysin
MFLSIWEFSLLFFLMFSTIFTSLSELAIASVNPLRLKAMAEKGSKSASIVLFIRSRTDLLFGTLLIANTIINTLITVLVSWGFVRLFQDVEGQYAERMAQGLTSVVCIASISLLEVFAKTMGTAKAERSALICAYPVRILVWILFPAVYLFTKLSNLMCSIFGVKPSFEESNTSMEDVRAAIKSATEKGTFESYEGKVVGKVTMMGEITAREIMIPRTDIKALPVEMPASEAISRILSQRYSRYPVFRGSLDDIVGVLHAKDLLACVELEGIIILHDIIFPARFVPLSATLKQILEIIRTEHSQLVIVVDEIGQTAGIVTLEDVVDEFFGEASMDNAQEAPIIQNKDGTLSVDGRIAVRFLNEEQGLGIESPAVSIGGHIQHLLGRAANIGEFVEDANAEFRVVSMHGRRISRVSIHKRNPNTPTEAGK